MFLKIFQYIATEEKHTVNILVNSAPCLTLAI